MLQPGTAVPESTLNKILFLFRILKKLENMLPPKRWEIVFIFVAKLKANLFFRVNCEMSVSFGLICDTSPICVITVIDFSPPTLLTTKTPDFKITPPRTNMEPESDPFAKGHHLNQT